MIQDERLDSDRTVDAAARCLYRAVLSGPRM
jgi:hypothetical protein